MLLNILIIIGLVALVLALFTYHVNPHTLLIIERQKNFHRIANPGYNLLIPWWEKIAGEVSTRLRQLTVPINMQIDTLSELNSEIVIRFKANVQSARDAFYLLPDPIAAVKHALVDEAKGYVSARNHHGQRTQANDLQSHLAQHLAQFLNQHGYQLDTLSVTEHHVTSDYQHLSLSSSNSLARLLIPLPDNTTDDWYQKCQSHLWSACLVMSDKTETVSSDGCPYLRVQLPPATPDNLDPCGFSDAVSQAFANNLGIQLRNPENTQTLMQFTLGDIIHMQNTQHLPSRLGIDRNGLLPLSDEQLIPMGEPSEELLPLSLRPLLYQYLNQLNIREPSVMAGTRLSSDLELGVIFNIFPTDFNSENDYKTVCYQLRWILPQKIKLFFSEQMSECALNDFYSLMPSNQINALDAQEALPA